PGSGGTDAGADKPGSGGADAGVDKPGSGGTPGTGGTVDSGVDNPPADAATDASDGPGPSTSRRTIALAQGWRFIKMDVGGAATTAFDDSAWAPVTVPHTWNSSDGQDGGNDYYRGIGWYRTHVTVPAEEAGRRIYVEFDGANIVTTVWVNGVMAGMHQGGFARFRFDVTSMIKTGAANVIAVQVSNAAGLSANIPPVTADFTFFGGLYRDVRLVTAEPAHLDLDHFGSSGVLATQSNVSRQSATVAVRASVTNAGAASFNATVAVKLLAADGSTVQMTSASATIAAGATSDVPLTLTVTNPHLWDGLKDPYLYRLQVDVKNGAQTLDSVVEPLGLRFFSFDANTGFSLNGNHLGLYGANKHQDRLNKGWAVLPSDLDEDMAIVRDLGATALRLAHYQHAQHFYDLCDQNGIIVWAEVPVVNSVTAGTPFADNAKQQLTELIRQSGNHPSIVMWSLSNEVADSTPVIPLMTAMNTLAHQEDPSRPTTLATNFAPNGSITKTVDLLGINRYFGWYTGNYGQFAADVDSAHGVAGRPLAISEYGAGAGITIHTATPTIMDHSEEYQSLLHEAHWKAISARPFLWGSFLWNLFDFAVDSRNEGDTPGRNDKGLVTYDRKTKKDAFYYYKANWSSDPFVYITERRWSQRPVGTYQVKIYSNGDTANLTVNGVAQGAKTATDHIFIWTGIALHAGANTLAASATVSGKAVTDTVTVTGN
ncbi:MAG TPA: glycoside hydrolase family 2 TIM barrel-domain containing protein, partial [Polyangia bacterium]|nr:glycoside hydrolase family 2 TIM barrel-domain containing protein [Polyangia bacterium]